MKPVSHKRRRKRTVEEIRPILRRAKDYILMNYGTKVEAIILYGSFIKGTADEDSDIDIAVIFRAKIDRSKEMDKIYDFLYELELESGELISIKPLSNEELKNSRWPLYTHIKKEGISLWKR